MRRLAALLLLVSCVPPPLEEVLGVPQVLDLPVHGLFTSPNEHGEIPKGALVQADDVVFDDSGVLTQRRGQASAIASGATSVWPFSDRLLLHKDAALSYTDAGVTTATAYAAAVSAPTSRRVRFAALNGNAYLTSSQGVKRLESVTGSPVDAGVPMGLDVQGALTGSSGFLANDSAVGYRVVWGLRDANGNLLLGAPSGRAVLSNSAGGTRDVSVSTSVPSGLTSSHFWQLYRTANAVTAATDPGDEMGLVYEGPPPASAAITQLVRTSNVVTATTSAAHGYSVGQIVRVGPGGSVAGAGFALVAVGASTVAASSTDGITWTSRTIPAGDYYAVARSSGVFAAVGASVAATTPDGTTWTSRTIPAGTYYGICWSGSQFVAVGASVCATSPDGTTWTARTMPGSRTWKSVVWTGSQFVAVAGTVAGNYAATSPNGITWTEHTIDADGSINVAAWNGSVVVAAGNGGFDVPRLTTSPDGVTWTQRTSPTGAWLTAASNGSTTILAGSGTTQYAASSTDGVTWTARTLAAGAYRGAVWDGSQFVLVGTSTAATSPDGITWTVRTIPAGTYNGVTAGGSGSILFAAGEYTLTTVPLTTTFTYAETGSDGTLTQANTATPLTATVVDSIPSTFAGATLYTSQSQESILASHFEPPAANDVASFRGSLFWLGTTSKALLDFWMLAAGGTSGVQANDTITINGVTFTAKASEAVGSREFAVVTSGTPSTNVRDTAASLIRVVNRAQGSPVYARDSSSANEQPGHIEFTARARADTIVVAVSRAASWAFTSSGQTKAPESNPHRLAWSPKNIPDAHQPTAWADVGEKQKDGLAIRATRDSLFVIKEDGIWRATGDGFSYANGPTLLPFDTTTEIVAPETAVVLDNIVFALSTKGVVQISDTGVTIISGPIADQVARLLVEPMLTTVRSVAFGVAYEAEGRYLLWIPTASSDTQATKAFVYDHFQSIAKGEPIWTVRTDDASAGVVNPYDGKLVLATSSALTKERKTLDYTDYADGTLSVTINSATGATATLADATGVAAGDMLVVGANHGIVLSIATNTLALDRTWAGGTGAATVYKAIPAAFEFAPAIPAPGGQCQFSEASFLFRELSGGYFAAGFSTEIVPTWATVPFYGTRDYALVETALAPLNLRTWVTRDQQRAERLRVRFTHSQAFSPFRLEGLSILFRPISARVRR